MNDWRNDWRLFGAAAISLATHAALFGLLLAIEARTPEAPLVIEISYVDASSGEAPPVSAVRRERPAAAKPPRPRAAPERREAPVPEPRPDAELIATPAPAVADAEAASQTPAGQIADAGAASEPIAGSVADGGAGEPIAAGRAARPPVLLEKQLPEYPSDARVAGISGEVVLGAVLDQRGRIEEVDVLRSVAPLDEAAIRAVKRWRFRPATDEAGRPIRVTLKIPIRFTLR